ncbi:MAG: hypothetical protein C0605_12645 [Hyphomicrobiales bacterium]|nr:MAG: hypothetical protein C0605_12645 [Hyphomicrobiales bacterium]
MGRAAYERDLWYDRQHLSRSIRKRTWLAISQDLDHILVKFYAKLKRTGYKHILDRVNIEALKRKQTAHWEQIFVYDIDKAYRKRIDRMNKVHNQLEIEPTHYVTAYLYFMNMFQRSILAHAAGPHEAHQMISAMQIIVSDDLSRSLESYYRPSTLQISADFVHAFMDDKGTRQG